MKPVATPFAAWVRARLAAEPAPPTIELTCTLGDEVSVPIDGALLNRALHNILANARAHGHAAGLPIDVRVEGDGKLVRIVARDRGPGFPEPSPAPY